ncbi:MAG: carbamoyltransferase C-terminal domain-containing protein, partial [bacterium]
AAGDAGGALGAALFAWHQYLGNKRESDEEDDKQSASLLGPSYSQNEISSFLKAKSINYMDMPRGKCPEFIAELLEKGNVAGLFQGRMEYGPRALGCRSIIGDARNKKMQSVMNLKIKFRESFRPFAPMVMIEHVQEYFNHNSKSPYMLLVADVLEKRRTSMTGEQENLFGIEKLNIVRSVIPAVTHVDYSARLQTVNKKDNPYCWEILNAFNERTGCPVLVNTSFNVRGEPIVCTPQDAYLCFMRTEMDYLVLENFILDKKEQAPMHEDSDWTKEFELD